MGCSGGDLCLKKIGETITACFPGALVGHLTADHFAALLPSADLEAKLKCVCPEVNSYINDDGIQLKAAIYRPTEEDTLDDLRHGFDLIKIDMGFFRHFDIRSRQIITSVVTMARMLGIQTLAEGVETEEQVRFLQEIGCDMMQGYYYSEQSILESLQHRNLPWEAIEWKKFYDSADACVTNSDTPRAVMEYDRKDDQIRYLYLNRQEREQLRSIGRLHGENSEFILNVRNNPLHARLLKFYEQMMQTGEQAVLHVSDNSFFVRLEGKQITRQEDRCIFLMSIVNITEDRRSAQQICFRHHAAV